MSAPDPWAGLLDPGEEILWQGRPERGFALDLSAPALIPMGLFFMAFSVVWMSKAMAAGGVFWMFGLAFFGIGFHHSIGVHLWKTYLRRVTFYTLTNQRAFIATNVLGRRSLRSFPIDAASTIDFVDGPKANIYFHNDHRRRKKRALTIPVGFEAIRDGRHVMGLIRNLGKDS